MQLCLFVHPETAGIKLVSLATQRCYLWYLNCSSSCGTGGMHLEKMARTIHDSCHVNRLLHRPYCIFLLLCQSQSLSTQCRNIGMCSPDISCSENLLASCNYVCSSIQKQWEWSLSPWRHDNPFLRVVRCCLSSCYPHWICKNHIDVWRESDFNFATPFPAFPQIWLPTACWQTILGNHVQ